MLTLSAVPMIPQALFAILAITRIGAIHAVVFGGFSASALAQRIDASRPRAIMTASCGIEGTKGPLSYQPLVKGATQKSDFKPETLLVWQRDALRWESLKPDQGELNWNKLVRSARSRGVRAKSVPLKSSDGVYIIYTSGTTGMYCIATRRSVQYVDSAHHVLHKDSCLMTRGPSPRNMKLLSHSRSRCFTLVGGPLGTVPELLSLYRSDRWASDEQFVEHG